jgi:transcription elongation factor SPT6
MADPQTFKFLTHKPVEQFANDPQFLHILRAEEEGLITIDVNIPDDSLELFTDAMYRCVEAKDYGTVATAWNKLRKEVVQGLVKDHLLPSGSKWLREHMKSEAEDYVAEHCGKQLEYVSALDSMTMAKLSPARERSAIRRGTHGARRDAKGHRYHQRPRRLQRRRHGRGGGR